MHALTFNKATTSFNRLCPKWRHHLLTITCRAAVRATVSVQYANYICTGDSEPPTPSSVSSVELVLRVKPMGKVLLFSSICISLTTGLAWKHSVKGSRMPIANTSSQFFYLIVSGIKMKSFKFGQHGPHEYLHLNVSCKFDNLSCAFTWPMIYG